MSSKSKKAGNLVALGSAAVVAVYGAGFMRTAAAAERFAEQSDERVLSPEDAAAPHAEMKSATTGSVANASSAASPESRLVVPPAKSAPAAALNKADATIAMAESFAAVAPVNARVTVATADKKPAPERTPSPVAVSTAAVPATAPVTPTAVVAAAPAPIVPAATAPPVTAPVTATTTEAPAASPGAPKLKDGEFTGYGTSRHGDVEVYLETTDGRITYIKISQCLTQYSCSWISDLPKQVLARQNANVDGVSGATQSVNAFYYAVVQALAKAK